MIDVAIEQGWLAGFVEKAERALKKRALAVDVGANVGGWTETLADKFDSVIAVEPDPRAYRLIADRDNVRVAKVAAGEKAGKAMLYKRPAPLQNSLLESHPINGDPVVDREEVDVVTLDSMMPAGADFVKIDVEGAEVEVLRGCSSDGRWHRTFFIVECHDNFADVEQELRRLGKDVEKIPHPSSGAHPGHCWAAATPHDDSPQPVVQPGRRNAAK